jgi:hypothetical protein
MVPDYCGVPLDVQIALADMTMIEEMLISPVLPIMTILRLHSGQNIQRGYVCSFKQSNVSIIQQIPRLSSKLPIMVVTKKNINGDLVQLHCNKKRLAIIINYYIQNIPAFKDYGITFSVENMALLPEDGQVKEIVLVEEDTVQNESHDTGPEVESDIDDNDNIQHTFLEHSTTDHSEEDVIRSNINGQDQPTITWPVMEQTPINEYTTNNLASLCFPKLFLFGQGDPTRKDRICAVKEHEATSHLIKFATIHPRTRKLYYPFAMHERFIFWMNDRIRRHRIMDQTNVYLKNNPGDASMTIEELQEITKIPNTQIKTDMPSSLIQDYMLKENYLDNLNELDCQWSKNMGTVH